MVNDCEHCTETSHELPGASKPGVLVRERVVLVRHENIVTVHSDVVNEKTKRVIRETEC